MSDMHPSLQRALDLYSDQMERTASLIEPADRIRWRQYACAALSGLNADPAFRGNTTDAAASHADLMLLLEHDRFGVKP